NVAVVVDEIISVGPAEMTTPLAWMLVTAYAVQIYFDFSGYSDMAIGLGKMFGFDILENFNYPYISKSIREFWQRWHISLSNWFKDYLYLPLGGSRGGAFKTYRNLISIFLITGFWHGASWSYVFWGLFHGFFMIIERLGLEKFLARLGKPFQHAYFIAVIMFSWAFFRIEDLSYSTRTAACMLGFCAEGSGFYQISTFATPVFWTAFVIGSFLSFPFFRNFSGSAIITGWKPAKAISIVFYITVLFLCTISLVNNTYNPFIYFRF
ncbi:MAG TPA: membrane-bound O-acyltransferase family protein, partial [Flavobacteriales bacterium]|nr:membrane-bound O-acyltransferase family protein [Flavobacteriales bacterium]